MIHEDILEPESELSSVGAFDDTEASREASTGNVAESAYHPKSKIDQEYGGRAKASAGKGPDRGITSEMMELAYLITQPEGDPNTNFRKLGFGGHYLG